LMEQLDKMKYIDLAKSDQEMTDAAAAALKNSPLPIFVG